MSFWTQSNLEPKRSFRFQIISDGWGDQSNWWWAKSIDKPSFDVSNNEYQLINHKFKYPGIVTWKNISITVVDIANGGPSATQALEAELATIGYTRPDKNPMKGIGKTNQSTIDGLLIQQLSSDGAPIDEFKLVGAFIVSTSYNRLDYSDDGITETTIEIAYDYADYSGKESKSKKTSESFAISTDTGMEVPENLFEYEDWVPPGPSAEAIEGSPEGGVSFESVITDN